MASVDYINAAFDSALHDIQGLVRLLPDIPFVDEQGVAMQKIRSPEGRRMLLKLIRNAIAAVEEKKKKKAKA